MAESQSQKLEKQLAAKHAEVERLRAVLAAVETDAARLAAELVAAQVAETGDNRPRRPSTTRWDWPR